MKEKIKSLANKNSSVRRSKQNALMLLSNYVVCDKKISRFIKNKEASRLESHYVVFSNFNNIWND